VPTGKLGSSFVTEELMLSGTWTTSCTSLSPS